MADSDLNLIADELKKAREGAELSRNSASVYSEGSATAREVRELRLAFSHLEYAVSVMAVNLEMIDNARLSDG